MVSAANSSQRFLPCATVAGVHLTLNHDDPDLFFRPSSLFRAIVVESLLVLSGLVLVSQKLKTAFAQ